MVKVMIVSYSKLKYEQFSEVMMYVNDFYLFSKEIYRSMEMVCDYVCVQSSNHILVHLSIHNLNTPTMIAIIRTLVKMIKPKYLQGSGGI